MNKYEKLVKFATACYKQSQRIDVDLNDVDFYRFGPILEELKEAEKDEPRHGAFAVCYVLDAETESDWEAFDCEADAVKRYEELVKSGDCYTVTLAKPIRSTDYDCEPA